MRGYCSCAYVDVDVHVVCMYVSVVSCTYETFLVSLLSPHVTHVNEIIAYNFGSMFTNCYKYGIPVSLCLQCVYSLRSNEKKGHCPHSPYCKLSIGSLVPCYLLFLRKYKFNCMNYVEWLLSKCWRCNKRSCINICLPVSYCLY